MTKLLISDFDYNLPDSRIAKYPLERRDESKLLVYNNNQISEDVFKNVDQHIPSNSLVLYNETRVIQARLLFKKATGASIEIFCLEPVEPRDFYMVFQQKARTKWKCFTGNLKKWKEGPLQLSFETNKGFCNLNALKAADHGAWQEIEFTWDNENITFGDILETVGHTPIPPYLKRESEAPDKVRYQTIYSLNDGSVAAPTAGLHFTPQVFEKLENKNISYKGVTLHVGAGTFKPVSDDDVADHIMHTEHFFVDKTSLELIIEHVENITSVGTTTLRTLESLYWIGYKLIKKIPNPFEVHQWEWRHNTDNVEVKDALFALYNYMNSNALEEIHGSTCIIITPGYKIKTAKRLITNFHQPKSTLLLLVCAFIGDNWKQIYNYALENNFRFLSYGDSSILVRE